jgi:type I restriction enzyme, S subunit
MKQDLDLKKLPSSWKVIELGDMLNRITNGLTSTQHIEPPGIPVTRIETISFGTVDFSRVRYIRDIDGDKRQRFLLKLGDILFSHINSDLHLGKTAVVSTNKPLLHGMNLLLLRTNKELLDSHYLHYLLNYYRYSGKFIEIAQHAVNQSSLNQRKIKSLQIPVAPPNEQTLIVDEIEKQFSRLDEATTALKRIKANLKRYKASVLKAAVEGKLTEEWRKTYSRKKTIVFPWPHDKLKNFTSKVGSGATPRGGKNAYKTEGIPLIRSMNVHFPQFQFEGLAFIDNKQAKQLDNVVVKTEDVLLNITGASIGRVTKAPKSMDGGRVNQHVCIIRPTSDINPDFLSIFLASPNQQHYIDEIQVGATRQALTKSMILNFEIPLPHIDEQKAIVGIVEKHISILEEVEKEVDNNTTRTECLRQSILKKAFSGKLVPQDPNEETVRDIV